MCLEREPQDKLRTGHFRKRGMVKKLLFLDIEKHFISSSFLAGKRANGA